MTPSKRTIGEKEFQTIQGAVAYYSEIATDTNADPALYAAAVSYPHSFISEYWARLDSEQAEVLLDVVLKSVNPDGDDPALSEWRKLASALDEDNQVTVVTCDNRTHHCFVANGGRYYPLKQYVANPMHETYIPDSNIAQK